MKNIIFFKTPNDLRNWFEKNHETAKELFVGYYKVHTKRKSITWSQSVDEAICFGWIDGIRKKIDEDSYQIRFTPRNPKSIWSTVNIKKFKNLKKLGLIKQKGLEAFSKKIEEKSMIYSYERNNVKLSKEFENEIKKNKLAWDYFSNLAASYKKASIHWIMSAKRLETQKKRLQILIESSAQNKKVPPLRINK
ncbi:YdeI/OmpD-associated family protein [Candidatus Woesearchaeota archaeon]|nr:YdeI/OmpD-associated family protein [Candidatus Woesearchaeota archaeon]